MYRWHSISYSYILPVFSRCQEKGIRRGSTHSPLSWIASCGLSSFVACRSLLSHQLTVEEQLTLEEQFRRIGDDTRITSPFLVTKLTAGGAALKSGSIHVGDLIHGIDGTNVESLQLHQVASPSPSLSLALPLCLSRSTCLCLCSGSTRAFNDTPRRL